MLRVVGTATTTNIINGMHESQYTNSDGVRPAENGYNKAANDALFPNVSTLERTLRDKITQHVSKDTDKYRQAFKLYTATHGITYDVFRTKTGILVGNEVPDSVCRKLFKKFDIDNSGDIDLKEFMEGLFPPSLSSQEAWNDQMRKGHREERIRNKQKPPKLAQGQWTGTAKEVERKLQDIVAQRTSKESDRIRQAFKLFTSASHITPEVFERRIRVLMGVSIPKFQCRELFEKYDTDHSGDLDLAEFVSGLMPKDYTNNPWYMEEEDKKSKWLEGHPFDTKKSSWKGNSKDLERQLQDIVTQRTSKESDRTRQAFKLFTSASSITRELFQQRIEVLMGCPIPEEQCRQLFNKYDIDNSGDIDLSEFVVGLMPKDYTEVSWNVQRENQERRDHKLASKSSNNPDFYKSVWNGSLKELELRLQDTITQHTSKGSDQIRQAFSLFTAARGIKPDVFKRGLEKMICAKISDTQSMELFLKYDTDGSGDIDLQEFVAGLMPKDYKGKSLFSEREDQRRENHKKLLEAGSKKAKWDLSLDDLQRRLQDKVVQHTSRASDQFRQAFRLFTTTHNIKPNEFKKQIDRMMDADVPEEQCQKLFERFDTDHSGDIDLQEFINGIMPKDYQNTTWNINSDNDRRKKDMDRRAKMKKNGIKGFHATGVSRKKNLWKLDDIEYLLQDKITQRTSKSSDQFRQAFKLFTAAGGITPKIFQTQIDKFLGTTISPEQAMQLFHRYDTDHSGDIDLQEFVNNLMPKDYGLPPPVRKYPRPTDKEAPEFSSPSPPPQITKRPQSTGSGATRKFSRQQYQGTHNFPATSKEVSNKSLSANEIMNKKDVKPPTTTPYLKSDGESRMPTEAPQRPSLSNEHARTRRFENPEMQAFVPQLPKHKKNRRNKKCATSPITVQKNNDVLAGAVFTPRFSPSGQQIPPSSMQRSHRSTGSPPVSTRSLPKLGSRH